MYPRQYNMMVIDFNKLERNVLGNDSCGVQAQKHAIRQLNILKYRKSDLNLSVLDGFTEDNLHTRIGAYMPSSALSRHQQAIVGHYLTSPDHSSR